MDATVGIAEQAPSISSTAQYAFAQEAAAAGVDEYTQLKLHVSPVYMSAWTILRCTVHFEGWLAKPGSHM